MLQDLYRFLSPRQYFPPPDGLRDTGESVRDRGAIWSTLHQITTEVGKELGFVASSRPSGGGHGTGLDKPLPEDRVCLCVRISCFAERGRQRFTAEIQPLPGVLTRDAAFRFEKRDGRLATRRDLRGERRKEPLAGERSPYTGGNTRGLVFHSSTRMIETQIYASN